MSALTKHLEIVTYVHKAISVAVQIDYDLGQVSLVEAQKNSVPTQYKGKQWVFTHRGLEYMQGWQDIFDAMKHAVIEATRELKIHQEAKDRNDALTLGKVVRRQAKKKP